MFELYVLNSVLHGAEVANLPVLLVAHCCIDKEEGRNRDQPARTSNSVSVRNPGTHPLGWWWSPRW
eukprot:1129917-Amphidinium_carterae.2